MALISLEHLQQQVGDKMSVMKILSRPGSSASLNNAWSRE